jgi:hypothetical protein
MAQPRPIEREMSPAEATSAPDVLFKADRPRAIDQHIDYFGGGPQATPRADEDPCGEALLDAFGGS